MTIPKTKTMKITKKGLKAKADKLFSLQVREKGYCELSGKDEVACGGVLQCAHIIGRANHVLRWELNNALCICAGHHVYYTHNPEAWREIIALNFPKKVDYIVDHKKEIWDKDIQRVISELEA